MNTFVKYIYGNILNVLQVEVNETCSREMDRAKDQIKLTELIQSTVSTPLVLP